MSLTPTDYPYILTYGRRIIPAMELPEGPTEWSVQLSVPTATKVSKDSVLPDSFLTSSAFAAFGALRQFVLLEGPAHPVLLERCVSKEAERVLDPGDDPTRQLIIVEGAVADIEQVPDRNVTQRIGGR